MTFPLHLQEYLSLKSILAGAGVALLLYGLLFGWVAMQAPQTLEAWKALAPSKTIVVKQSRVSLSAYEQIDGGYDTPQSGAHNNTHTATGAGHGGLPSVNDPRFVGLYERTENGVLPRVRYKDNLSVFTAFKRPFDKQAVAGKPVIALGIVGLGLSETATESAIRTMPAAVSLVFSPYAGQVSGWAAKARAYGHESWLTLPLETRDYPADDPGPKSLIIDAPERQNREKLDWLMARAQGIVGFVGQEDSIFLQKSHDMRPVMGALFQRGLGFLNTEERPAAPLEALAAGQHAPYGTIDLWLDSSATKEDIRTALAALEDKARTNGQATALIHAYPVSYHMVLDWLKLYEAKGFALAPLSALMKN